MTTGPYRDGRVHVRATECDRCLFGPARLVSGAAARGIVADTRTEDGASFICHRDALHDEPVRICAGWWDRFAGEDWIMRLAMAQGIVTRADGPNG